MYVAKYNTIKCSHVGLPTMSDYLVAYATIPDRPAFRNDLRGSYFILELDEVFRKLAEKEQLIDILTEVNRKMAKRTFDGGQYKQQPHFVSALRKKLYLHPGKQIKYCMMLDLRHISLLSNSNCLLSKFKVLATTS